MKGMLMETTTIRIVKPIDVAEDVWSDFIEWHKKNPDVWHYFEKFAMELIDLGVKECGSITILGRVRYEYMRKIHEEYKVNNNYAPMYSRVFVQKYPQHSTFFKFRELN